MTPSTQPSVVRPSRNPVCDHQNSPVSSLRHSPALSPHRDHHFSAQSNDRPSEQPSSHQALSQVTSRRHIRRVAPTATPSNQPTIQLSCSPTSQPSDSSNNQPSTRPPQQPRERPDRCAAAVVCPAFDAAHAAQSSQPVMEPFIVETASLHVLLPQLSAQPPMQPSVEERVGRRVSAQLSMQPALHSPHDTANRRRLGRSAANRVFVVVGLCLIIGIVCCNNFEVEVMGIGMKIVRVNVVRSLWMCGVYNMSNCRVRFRGSVCLRTNEDCGNFDEYCVYCCKDNI
jgi:hypothetical protein